MTPASKPALKVGAAQIESIPADLDRNLRKHLDVIDAARADGVDFLLFPELSLCGHGGGAQAAALALDHRHLQAVADATGPMLTLAGGIEATGKGTFRNALFALREGSLVHVHRKVHLATYGRLDDGAWFAAGERVDTFAFTSSADDGAAPASSGGAASGTAMEWRIAPMICADTWNPPLVHLAAAQDATLMAVAASSALEAVGDGFDNPAGWDVNLRFHALTYGLPIVMANRVGIENAMTFWGGSRIVDAFGVVVATAEPSDAQTLVTATLELGDIERARVRLPTMRDANLPFLSRELRRLTREG